MNDSRVTADERVGDTSNGKRRQDCTSQDIALSHVDVHLQLDYTAS